MSPIKQWVRNLVIEIHRLTNSVDWFYIEIQNTSAGLGTKKGTNIEDISGNSSWFNGQEWTKLEKEEFHIKSFHEIKSSQEDVKKHNDENIKDD